METWVPDIIWAAFCRQRQHTAACTRKPASLLSPSPSLFPVYFFRRRRVGFSRIAAHGKPKLLTSCCQAQPL